MENKDLFQSKATWGAVFLLLNPVLNKFGITIDQEGMVEAASTIVGAALFVWGQLTRKSGIGSVAGVKVK